MAAGDITAVRSEASDGYSAASFDGIDDSIRLGTSDKYWNDAVGINKTFSIWCLNNKGTTVVSLLDFDGVVKNFCWCIENSQIKFFPRDTYKAYKSNVISSRLSGGKWNHIVLRYSRVASDMTDLKFYLNGVEVSSYTDDGFDANKLLWNLDNSYHLKIGNTYKMRGLVKDLKIYNKALSQDEITALASGLDIDRSNLIGEWKLQDNYLDTSGHGNHGTNSGTFLTNTLTNKIKADMQGMNLPAATDKIIALPRRGSPTIVAAKRTP